MWLFLVHALSFSQQSTVTEHFSIQEGLSNLQVLDIATDQQGYIWVATELGLNRFASGHFKSYYQSDKMDGTAINSNEINTLCYDGGKLYIGTRSNGLNILDLHSNTFEYFLHDPHDKNSIATNDVTDIIKGDEQYLWLATYHQGLQRFDKKSKKFTRYNRASIPELPENGIWSLEKGEHGLLYIGHVSKGLSIFNATGGTVENFNVENTAGELPDNEVKALFNDTKGNLWIGTRHGLAVYNRQARKFRQIHLYSSQQKDREPFVYSITEVNGEIWVGAESSRLFIINPLDLDGNAPAIRQIDLRRGNNASIQKITPDNFGNIWIAIYGGGVDFISHLTPYFQTFPPKEKTSYFPPSRISPVVGILEQDQNTLIATEGTGIFEINAEGKQIHHRNGTNGLGDSFLFSAFNDHKNQLWLGPRSGGVVRYNLHSGDWQRIDLGEPVSEVRAIIETRQKVLWIAAKQGVFIHDPLAKTTKKIRINEPMLGDYAPRTLMEDKRGNVWVGTYGQGLYIYDSNFKLLKRLSSDDALRSNTINHIFGDKNNNIWIATNDGIAYQEAGRPLGELQSILPEGADAWHIIHAISQDANENIWCSTKSGLLRYLPTQKRFLFYDESFGIPLGGFVNGSVLRDSKGKLYFGMQDGLCYFNPAEIPLDLPTSPILISRFAVFGNGEARAQEDKYLSRDQKITLSHRQNSFRLELAVMDYGLNEFVEFSYMLHGHDAEWISLANERNLDFRNVPYGDYELRVRTRMKNGEWSKEYSHLFIEIKPPFYFSTLAWIVYATAIIGIIFVLLLFYIKKIRAESELQIIEHQHLQDEKLYNERLNFYTNITHELRTPLTLILGPLDDLLTDSTLAANQKGLVGTVQKSANRLFSLVNQLLEFRKVESQYKPLVLGEGHLGEMLLEIVKKYSELNTKPTLTIRAELPRKDIRTLFDPEIIQHIVDNILSNAYKYSQTGDIVLRLDYQKEGLSTYAVIKVQDSGPGIAPEHLERIFDKFYQVPRAISQGTGVGLALTKELVSIHGGKITVESVLGKGTTFTVRLITNAALDSNSEHLEQDPGEETEKHLGQQKVLILLVEDDPDLREYLATTLQSQYDTISAKNGTEGLLMAKQRIPDVILSDIMMPDMDGFTMLSKLKSERNTSHIPVIFLTAKDTDLERERGYSLGVDSFLTKPTSAAVLFNRIENLLEKKKNVYAEVITTLLETGASQPKQEVLKKEDSAFVENEFVQEFVKIVRDHLQDEVLDAAKLAQKMNMSQSTLYRKLKGITGKNINQLVRKVRIHRAAELLQLGQHNVTEVSFLVGMNSAIYFRQCFKEEFGMLPSEYQKRGPV